MIHKNTLQLKLSQFGSWTGSIHNPFKIKTYLRKYRLVFSRKKNYLLIYISELPLSSSTWSNEQEIRHYHHNSFESYPILLLDFSSNLDEVQYQTNHNRPPKLPVSKRQLGYPQQPQVVCNSTLEKKAKVSCWRTATTTKSCGNTTVRGSSKKQPHYDLQQKKSWNENIQFDGIFVFVFLQGCFLEWPL